LVKLLVKVGSLIGKVTKNYGGIDTLDTAGDEVGIVGGIFGDITDIRKSVQDPNNIPWDYIRVCILYLILFH
jgi:hypothetical protein